MKRKTVDFESQMKNSEQFLSKLNNIKKASKDLKDKNKLTLHRNIWVKQFKYLARLQRDATLQISEYFEQFDRNFQSDYEDRGIFCKDEPKTFSEMIKQYQQNNQQNMVNTLSQVQSLPLLLEKLKKSKKGDIDMNSIEKIVADIGQFLIQVQNANQSVLQNNQSTSNFGDFKAEEHNDDDFEDIVMDMKPIFDEVKGFDFHKQRYRKVQQGQNNLIQYLHSMSDKLSGDQISEVIIQFQNASNLLSEAMELQIEKISLDYEQALSLDEQITSESQNFQKINHFYQIYMGRGKSVANYYERVSIQFPKIGRKILERITNYIQARIYKQKKIKTVKRNYLREKEQIYNKVEKEVNLRIQNKIKKAQKQAESLSRREQKLKLQKQLQVLRQAYLKRVEAKRNQQIEIENKLKQEQRKKQALRKLYLDDLSKRAADVHEIKTEKQKKQQQLQKLQLQREELQNKKKIIQNKPKVNYRHSVDKKKIEKKLEEKEQRDNEKIIKQQRINKAIQKYPFRPIIEASEQRLNAPTQALIKKQNTKYDKADKIVLTKVDGYTVNDLMSDMRYRLNVAFQEAGLANTEYARKVINDISKRPNNN